MKQYKVTITNGDYPLSYTCDAISDAFECLRTLKSWAPERITFNWDDLMEILVQMRKSVASKIKGNGFSITVIEETDGWP